MSDREWIDRVRGNRPEDFSSGEVGKLRDEARRSPEVRKAIADEIRLDEGLHSTLGRSPLSTSQIVAHVTAAAGANTAGGGMFGALMGWLAVGVLTVSVGVVGIAVLPNLGGGSSNRELLSPDRGTILESPTKANNVERIDPIEDPRYVDDGTSPSDNLPAVGSASVEDAGSGHHSPNSTVGSDSTDGGKQRPVTTKSPAVKTPSGSVDVSQPRR